MKSIAPYRGDAAPAKICVIFPGALGDFICFLPALETLAQTAWVDLFSRREFADLAPDGVRVGSLERSEISALFRPQCGDDREARRFFRGYDAVYSWFASGNRDFAVRLDAVTAGRARVFPFRPARAAGHQADYYLSALRPRSASPAQPVVALRNDATRWCDDFWARHSLQRRAVLVIAPGSGTREKNWPAESFLAVIRWWHEMTGGAVLLLVGPVEKERGGIEPLLGGCCIVASDLSLSQAAALLSRSAVYLGNDSGVSHLAAAAGVRTIALFGPSDHRQWAPRGKKVVVVHRGLGCSPCPETTMKSCPHHACLSELAAEEIISILAQLPEVVILTR
jgi:ADP-heptose:LPS heptosyltransferase